MREKPSKKQVTFTATKIVSRPTTISFHTKEGKAVTFKAVKDVPKSVRVNFIAKKGK